MFPIKLSIGSFETDLHLIFESLAFIVGYRYFVYLRGTQKDKISDSNRLWIIIAASFGAFFFSRLLGCLENPTEWWNSKHPLLFFYANKTVIGALLGGLLVVEWVKKKLGETSSSGDLFTYPLILALIIGRIGCFSSGILEPTYGDETTFFMGMDLGDGVQRHPIALYEIIFLIFFWIILKQMENSIEFKNGIRFQLFMIFYLLFRFCIEFIKPGYAFFAGIGTIQICCLLTFIYYRETIYKMFVKPRTLIVNGEH